jgi:hypothetical protein
VRPYYFLSFVEFESDSQFKPKAIRNGSAKYGLNVAITDNTKYRNYANDEDDDLNPAFLGAQVCLGPQNSIRLHPGKPRYADVMLTSQKVIGAIDEQIGYEFSAELQYYVIAAHFTAEALPQLSQHFFPTLLASPHPS